MRALRYTKALWTVISGTHLRATCEVVKYELNRAAVMICGGLTVFRPPSDEANKKLKVKVGDNVYSFVAELGAFLGTESLQAWDLLANYLMYEFQGSEVGLSAFLSSQQKKSMLMTDIWMFYHSERLFLLKCINLVLAYCTDEDHPYQETLKQFMSRYDEGKFADLLVLQLEMITNEPYPHKDVHGVFMTDQYQLRWQNYNLREQIEVLHNIILHLEICDMSPQRMEKIIQICIDSRFGKQEEYKMRNTVLAMYYSKIIGYLQNIVILHYTNLIASGVLADEPCPIDLEELVSRLGNEEEHSLLTLSWTLVKVFQGRCKPSSEIMDRLAYLMMDSSAFKYLRKLLLCDVFQADVRLSNFVFRTAYDFVNLFASNFEIETFSSVPSLLDLVGPILGHKDNVDIFWRNETGIMPLFKVLTERFPADYLPFMNAVHSLTLYAGDHLAKIMAVYMNTECFAECLCDSIRENAVVTYNVWKLSVSRRPLVWSQFTLKQGTVGHSVQEEPPLVSWKCGFSIFEAIYEQLNELISKIDTVTSDEKVFENSEIALKVLRDYISTGVELKKIVMGVVNLVFSLINRLKTGKCYPTYIFALCLDITTVLLPKYSADVLKRLRFLDVLPLIHYVPGNVIEIFCGDYFAPKTVGTIIAREECIVGKYPLLMSYLTFIYKVVKGGTEVCPVDYYTQIVLPGVVFILGDVYPNYQSWHFVEDHENEMIAITCIKIIHELLHVNSLNQKKTDIPSDIQSIQNLVMFSLLNMKAGKVLLKTVSSGGAVLQTKMEKKLNWVSGETNFTNVLQLSLSILNRVLLLRPAVQEKTVISALENDIYCSPKESFKVIPTVASYINNNFSNVLPVLAVKVLRRFASDFPKTLLACLGMEGGVLREMIFRRLKSRTDSTRLKVALVQLVSACVDTQPGMCAAFFNLPTGDFSSDISYCSACYTGECVKHRDDNKGDNKENGGGAASTEKTSPLNEVHIRDDTKGGILLFVLAVFARASEEPKLMCTPLYGAAVELTCTLWLGENSAAVEFLRIKDEFWSKFSAPLFHQPRTYMYAYSEIFTIITLEVFHYGKQCHQALQKALEKFFDEECSYFTNWTEFVCEMCITPKISEEEPGDEKWDQLILVEERVEKSVILQKMEKQPPNVQMLIAWKRFYLLSTKLLSFKIGARQKAFLTMSVMKALQHEISELDLKPLLVLIELYLVAICSWDKHFFDDENIVKDRMQLMLKVFSGTYLQLPHRLKEAVLALCLQVVDCLADKLREDEVAAECMLHAATEIVLLEVCNKSVPKNQAKLKKGMEDNDGDDDGEESAIIKSLMHLLAPGFRTDDLSVHKKDSLSGKLSLILLHKLLKILIKKSLWLKEHIIADIRNGILVGLGRILSQIHDNFPPVNMLQFSVAVSAMNLVFFMIENGIMDNALDHQLPANLWRQLMPPKFREKHWLLTNWPQIYKPALEIIGLHLEARTFMFLDSAFNFVVLHDLFIVDAILAFRQSLNQNMLEMSKIALNFVRRVSTYPSHWRLFNESSLNYIMFGVMTCLHSCIALLVHPTALRGLLEKGEGKDKKKRSQEDAETQLSERLAEVHNQLLNITFLCLSTLQLFCPHLSNMVIECATSPVAAKPFVELNLDVPMYDDECIVAISFGALITLAHLCTQALSKVIRVPSPRPTMASIRGLGAGSSLLLTMDKETSGLVLEMTVELITSQGLSYLFSNTLSGNDKELFRRSLNTEMTFFIEFTKRSLRGEICSYTLETAVHAIKDYLANNMNLPMLRTERSVTPTKHRKLPSKELSSANFASPKAYRSSPSSSETSTSKPSCVRPTCLGPTSSDYFTHSPCSEDKSPETSREFHLPISETFMKFVVYVFSSIFDIFA